MFNSELIVSMWFVPVVLFILVPLAMLIGWGIMRLSKKTTNKVKQIEDSTKEALDNVYVEKVGSVSTV